MTVPHGPWHRASGADPETGPPHLQYGLRGETRSTLYPIWADRERRVVLAVTDHDGCWALTTEGIADADITAALIDFDQGGYVDDEAIRRTRALLLGAEHWSRREGTHGEG
jgi:hypothetical protein